MRIVLIATGTRGDVQPMIALGKGLVQAGHQIKLISGSNFTSWVESYGLEVFPTIDMEALMQSDLGIKWVESTSQLDQLKHMKALMNSVAETAIADMLKGTQDAELMIGGFVSEPFLQTISEKCDIPLISLALQPYRTTRSGAASLVPILPRSNSILNAMMGRFAERFTWSISAD
ncbi:MAG TPA: glycosyltransferase, partial [Phototrophicaceae bacterium]|nr:glycosyltransferase [Phototrophicaceae bacterium]